MEGEIKAFLKEIERPNRGRVLTTISFLLFATVVTPFLGIELPLVVPVILLIWVFESLFSFSLSQKLEKISTVKFFTFFQFIVDIFFLTITVYYIGTLVWITPIFYVFTLIYSVFYTSPKERWAISSIAALSYISLVFLEYRGVLPYRGIFPSKGLIHYDSYTLATIFTVFFVFLFISWTGSFFADRLRERREELEKINRELEEKIKERTREIEKKREELEQEIKRRTRKLTERTKELEKTQRALLNILEDVEEARKRVSEERDKTVAIIRSFTDGLLVLDRDNNFIEVNKKAEELLDLKKEDVLGKNIEEVEGEKLKSVVKLIYGKGEIKKIERKSLELSPERIVEITTVPFFKEKEKEGFLVVIHDITREKMIEKLKTEFVSISAHQLRTPLSAIKWSLKMILDGDIGPISKEQKEFLEKTYQSNERMINLVNDLLDVTRIEEGRFLYNPTINDFRKIVEKVVNNFREIAERKGVKLIFQKPREPLFVKVDEEKIELAVTNLVDNAIRYTLEGGKVEVRLKKKGENAEISVSDTGIGIPKDQQKRVFSRFFRAINAVRTQTEGTGLGLFITKNVVEAHKGKIWFESEEGKGTTFYFTIPLVSPKIK